ncbi:putative porin [Hyphomicrobium sp. NDB2Meth4]|uniref:putative porin n=1 Tax=Hyphomicrobium sp. NDB2Meth4 TaxID=1892846 RepID=UPI00093171BA|nr:putative porin [Hyphomicrobium sp. NDB2Meth4]
MSPVSAQQLDWAPQLRLAAAEGNVAEPGQTAAGTDAGAQATEAAPGPEAEGEKPTVSTDRAVSPNATVNLINVLVQKGVITQEQADELVPQVDDESMVTREAVKTATARAEEAAKAASAAASAATPPGSKRVSYVPEVVKQELRDEIKKKVMQQAKDEGWASPGKYPEWASRIKLYGDLRTRYEGHFYPGDGYNSVGQLYDYNKINTGSPYDVSVLDPTFGPLINTTQDRQRYRIRARIGMDADLEEGFSVGMRIATGSDNSPVSTNQTMTGNFAKYDLWLDRAYLKFEPAKSPFEHYGLLDNTVFKVGRFDNPFWRPTELVWDEDLGFDGFAVQGTHEIRPGLTAFGNVGAFAMFNTSLDFSYNEARKFESKDKYLYGAQIGANWQIRPTIGLTVGASVFEYQNVKGRLSEPCNLQVSKDCSTDHLRPSFAQKGNTYRYLRDIVPPVGHTPGTPFAQPEYFGLASDYMPVVFASRLDFAHFDPAHIMLDTEFVWNPVFNQAAIDRVNTNNCAPNMPATICNFDGGNIGFLARLSVGHKTFDEFGDWNVHVGYKYLESDATLDAFADSDFGLGGTNLKGYFLGGNFAVSHSIVATAKWMSANSIAGAPYAVDLLQVDLNAKF